MQGRALGRPPMGPQLKTPGDKIVFALGVILPIVVLLAIANLPRVPLP